MTNGLKSFYIKNFRGIDEIGVNHISPGRRIFFVGENSAAKTAVLQALTIAISGTRNAERFLAAEDFDDFTISVQLDLGGREHVNRIVWKNRDLDQAEIFQFNAFCAYSAFRTPFFREGNNSMWNMDGENHLLFPGFPLLSFENWLKDQALSGDADRQSHLRLQNTIDHLHFLIPDVEIRMDGSRFFYLADGFKTTFSQLGNAHQVLLATMGDILVRLFNSQPEKTDPRDLEGIVMIDELDAHLPVNFFKGFSKRLNDTFPKVQFICSLNASLFDLNYEKETSVFSITGDQKKGISLKLIKLDPLRRNGIKRPMTALETVWEQISEEKAKRTPKIPDEWLRID